MTATDATLQYDPPRADCPLCGGGPVALRLTDFRGHGIHGCRACGVEFMNPQYSDAALHHFYAGYINLHPGAGEQSFRSRLDVRTTGKERSLALLATFAPGRRILMVGCGDGLELRAAKAGGWKPEGYDVDAATTAKVAASEGVPVHCGDFHALPGRVAPFDALFLDQVIEHPKEPGRYLDSCVALLRPAGVLFLGMPNLGSLSNRLKTLADRLRLRSRMGRHYNTRHHLTFFRPDVMVRQLERRGLEVLCVRGSLKPQQNPLVAVLNRMGALLDSSFLVVARRPAAAGS
ncbi:MAG: class I SAM-dependent methyltransferase [Planctomycetota bacterium]